MKFFKSIIGVAVGSMLLCNLSYASIFNDLSETHWAYDRILEIKEKGIVNGYTDGSFKPENNVTREEFATILTNTMKLIPGDNITAFEDVEPSRWSKVYIDSVSMYLDGYLENGRHYFKPKAATIREDVAVAIVKALGLETKEDADMVLSSFKDEDMISESAKQYIATIVSNGIMKGNGNGTFNPKGELTRAEVVSVVYNVIEYMDNNSQNKGYKFYLPDYPLTLEELNEKFTKQCKSELDYIKDNFTIDEIKEWYMIDDNLSLEENIEDKDNDGIWDVLELNSPLNPNKKDSNGDGLVDAVSIYLANFDFINLSDDTDKDTLSNEEEILKYGTKFYDDDSDSDGVLDGEEVIAGLNPLTRDSDDDGISDYDEYLDPLGRGISHTLTYNDFYNNLLFEVDVIAKPSEIDDLSIDMHNSYFAPSHLSEYINVQLKQYKGTVRVDISTIKNQTPTLFYAGEYGDNTFDKVEGQYIKDDVLYAPVDKNGNYVIVDEQEYLNSMYQMSEAEIEAINSFWFLYTEVGSDWEVMRDESNKIVNNIEHSMVKFNIDSANGYKLYNKWGLKLKLNADKGYVSLAQSSLSPEVDFNAIQVLYTTDNGQSFKVAEYKIAKDSRGLGREVVRITVNESGIYGIFYK